MGVPGYASGVIEFVVPEKCELLFPDVLTQVNGRRAISQSPGRTRAVANFPHSLTADDPTTQV